MVLARSYTFVLKVVKAFFNISEDDRTSTGIFKVSKVALMRIIYSVADYWLMVASAAFIIIMDRQLGYGPTGLFLLMWAFDIAVAGIFISIWQRTGEDVTLGESYRRAADAIHAESRIAGYLAIASVCIKAAFWDGPEHIIIFFHRELQKEVVMLLVLLVLTAIQAAIWTPIYVLGFDSVVELYGYIIKQI